MPFRFLWHDIVASHLQGICCKQCSSVLSSASVFESVQAIKMLHEKDEVFYIAYIFVFLATLWLNANCETFHENYFFVLHLTFFSPMIMCLKKFSGMIFRGHWRIDRKKRKNVAVGNLAKKRYWKPWGLVCCIHVYWPCQHQSINRRSIKNEADVIPASALLW